MAANLTYRSPGPANIYIPSPEATGLIIGFSKDPKKFKIANYVKYKPVDLIIGAYTRLDPKQSVRVLSDADARWARGASRPKHEGNLTPFSYDRYQTERRDEGFILPDEVNDGTWNVKATHSRQALSQTMTRRTLNAFNLMTTAANWSGNTDTAQNLNKNHGYWDQASNDPNSPYYLAIKKTIDTAVLQILLGTNSIVSKKDLRIVMGPKVAQAISQTDEIRDMLKQAYPTGLQQVAGDMVGDNSEYNLPPKLYGLELTVEDQTIVSANQGNANDFQKFVWNAGDVVICSRPGGIEAEEGSENFSTLTFFIYENLTVEAFHSAEDRRENCHVVDDYDHQLTAAAAGYYIQSALSP